MFLTTRCLTAEQHVPFCCTDRRLRDTAEQNSHIRTRRCCVLICAELGSENGEDSSFENKRFCLPTTCILVSKEVKMITTVKFPPVLEFDVCLSAPGCFGILTQSIAVVDVQLSSLAPHWYPITRFNEGLLESTADQILGLQKAGGTSQGFTSLTVKHFVFSMKSTGSQRECNPVNSQSLAMVLTVMSHRGCLRSV